METMTNLIDSLMGKAEAVLVQAHKDGEEFIPTAFAIKDNGIAEAFGFPFLDEDAKIDAYREVGNRVSALDCTEVILIVDSFYREMNDEDDQYVADNWDTEKPSMYPKDMQRHCLVFFHIDFHTGTKMHMLKYEHVDGGIKVVGADKDYDSPGGELPENVAFGFMLAEAKKLGTNPDDGLSKAKEKYALLKG